MGIRAGTTKLPAAAAAATALEKAAEIRDQLAELDAADEQQKADRRRIALELLDADPEISEKELAADAGVTAEWVRRRFSDV
jgi:cysteine sulfinate desulfinase/cysteine desulfurase-like protein